MVWSLQANNNLGDFSWPKELDRKNYVKANKDGGLEDILAELDIARKTWEALTHPFPPTTMDPRGLDRWEKGANDYVKSSGVAKVVTSLTMIAKAAATMEKTKLVERNKKKIKLGTDALAALKTIRTSCETHAKSVTPPVLNPQITALSRTLRAAVNAKVLSMLGKTLSGFKGAATRGHPQIATVKQQLTNWPADPQAAEAVKAELGTSLFTCCRDMTQNLANLQKALDAGSDPAVLGLQARDVQTIPKIMATLVKWGNNSSASADAKKMTRAQLITQVKSVEADAHLYDQIAGRLA